MRPEADSVVSKKINRPRLAAGDNSWIAGFTASTSRSFAGREVHPASPRIATHPIDSAAKTGRILKIDSKK